jgi:hypothetical protein
LSLSIDTWLVRFNGMYCALNSYCLINSDVTEYVLSWDACIDQMWAIVIMSISFILNFSYGIISHPHVPQFLNPFSSFLNSNPLSSMSPPSIALRIELIFNYAQSSHFLHAYTLMSLASFDVKPTHF